MKAIFAVLSLIATMTLLSLAPSAAAAEMDAKTLFTDTHKCNMCHSVPAADIESKTKSEKMKGPDLGGKIDAPIEEIAAFMRGEAELDGMKHKPFKGTDEELQTIVDWLGSLEAQQ